jgi:hypothetical protein
MEFISISGSASMVASPGETIARISIIEQLYRPGTGRLQVPFKEIQQLPSFFYFLERCHLGMNRGAMLQLCLTPDIPESRTRISETVTVRSLLNIDLGGCHWLHYEQTLWLGLAPLGFEI